MENNEKKTTEEIFSGYELTPEEMIIVKGGEDMENLVIPNPPKIRI